MNRQKNSRTISIQKGPACIYQLHHYNLTRQSLKRLESEKDIDLICDASNAASCLSFLQHKQPDVNLMDISMPCKSGVDLCKELRSTYPAVFVIGLSNFNQFTFIDAMMENGASGYLLKNADKEEIIEAFHVVAKGKTFFSDEAASK